MMYLIANWKENLTVNDLAGWFTEFSGDRNYVASGRVEVIVASSYVLIHPALQIIKDLNINVKMASQDISEYPSGSHTGEVGAFALSSLVEYTIIGHSERRALGESTEVVARKAKLALDNKIKPIICFSSVEELNDLRETALPIHDLLFAYEPIESIGTGKSATVSNIYEFFKNSKLTKMIYGGSVDKDAIHPYLELDFLNGFLVGGASLDPTQFRRIFETIDKRK